MGDDENENENGNDNNEKKEEEEAAAVAKARRELVMQEEQKQKQERRSIEKSRMIYEMNWQIDDCIVDEDTCTDFCEECAGSGKQRCNFCRGTRIISFGNEFRTCLICDAEGKIKCSACSGT